MQVIIDKSEYQKMSIDKIIRAIKFKRQGRPHISVDDPEFLQEVINKEFDICLVC